MKRYKIYKTETKRKTNAIPRKATKNIEIGSAKVGESTFPSQFASMTSSEDFPSWDCECAGGGENPGEGALKSLSRD